MKNVILFGPPGIGKSTLIGELKKLGHKAVDLEDIDSRLKYQLPSQNKSTVFGGADLDPKRTYPGDVKVLLYLPQKQYEQRRRWRDNAQPSKAGQKPHNIEDWLTLAEYDYILDATKRSVAYQIGDLLMGNKVESLRKEDIVDARNTD